MTACWLRKRPLSLVQLGAQTHPSIPLCALFAEWGRTLPFSSRSRPNPKSKPFLPLRSSQFQSIVHKVRKLGTVWLSYLLERFGQTPRKLLVTFRLLPPFASRSPARRCDLQLPRNMNFLTTPNIQTPRCKSESGSVGLFDFLHESQLRDQKGGLWYSNGEELARLHCSMR